MYYNASDQPVHVVNVTNFTGNYTLDNLRSLEGGKSRTVTARTLAGGLYLSVPIEQVLNTAKLGMSRVLWIRKIGQTLFAD